MLSWFPDPRGADRKPKPPAVTALEAHIEELESQIELLHAEKADGVRLSHLLVMVILAQQIEIERLKGFDVKDDRKPRGGLDLGAVSTAWDAELKRRGME